MNNWNPTWPNCGFTDTGGLEWFVLAVLAVSLFVFIYPVRVRRRLFLPSILLLLFSFTVEIETINAKNFVLDSWEERLCANGHFEDIEFDESQGRWYRWYPLKKVLKIKMKKVDLFCKDDFRILWLPTITQKRQKLSGRMVLINVDKEDTDYSSHGQSWGHLGLLHIGTVAEQEGLEVVLWDEFILGKADLGILVQPGDVVGLSVLVTSVVEAQDYARKAKGIGASYVFCGNDQASFRAQQMLRNNAIDGVFIGDDLTPIRKVLRTLRQESTLPDSEVAGFVRRGQSMVVSRKRRQDAEYFIIPNLSLYPQEYWEKVWDNHRKLNGFEYSSPNTLKNSTILLAGGCSRGKNLCAYCSIYDAWNIRKANEEQVSNLISTYKDFGINDFFSVADSMYEMAAVLEQIRESGQKLPNLALYARAAGIARHPFNINLLQEIVDTGGVVKFNIGLDSGDDRILRNGVQKGHGIDIQYRAIRQIKEAGIHLHCSFVFGSPGETRASCERTLEFIHYVADQLGNNLVQIESDLWWLNFGAPCSKVFYDYGYACELAGKAGKTISKEQWEIQFASRSNELVVPLETERAWYRFFTSITLEEAQEYLGQVDQFEKLTGRAFI